MLTRMTRRGEREEAIRSLMPALIDVQRNLEARLNLSRLAAEQGYSPYHFQRLFTRAIGETPRAHIERLRLEKAAYKLWISDESALEVALSVGFRSAFRNPHRQAIGSGERSSNGLARSASRISLSPCVSFTTTRG